MNDRYLHEFMGIDLWQNRNTGMYFYLKDGRRMVFDDYDDMCFNIESEA